MVVMKIALVFALFAGETLSKKPTFCLPGWLDASDAGLDCLLFSVNRNEWLGAKQFCLAAGGKLVAIREEKQLTFLQAFFLESDLPVLDDPPLSPLNAWIWVDG